jgi:hypothetical protein
MASGATTNAARRAARAAAVAAQEELARRTRANMEDLALFFSARERVDKVDEWLAERMGGLQDQAAQRRAEQYRLCGAALRSMRDRGESLRDVARMTGVGEKVVRELIRAAGASSVVDGTSHGDTSPNADPSIGDASASASDEPPSR